ncbi:MAG: FumA C-terminus/TtdB family hydratase beta subunit [Methanobrevibacter sp.]|jgi:fumarate hydratase subunit beta|nr:FumA C-terminus/TtdB family hydratase beta subunit [Candidatus Methanovirga basalitermitum]
MDKNNNKKIIKLETPLDDGVTSKLRVGDVVTISGKILTARDQAHKRIFEEGSPIDLNNTVIFHAGPIIKTKNLRNTDLSPNSFELISIGPTTSTRMNPYQGFILDLGVKAIIGKGGMDKNTVEALKRNNAVYLAAVGGCATLYSDLVEDISNVFWFDLGIPEAIWELNVKEFGPLIVAIDSNGGNIFKR